MGATYTRQSTYSDGDVITAAHTNDEFNQLLAAFAASTGHTHDGTTAEGGPITKLLGTSLTFGDGTAGTDITVTFDGETNDGVLKWMEDEDYFEFSDDILVASTEKLQFRDTAIYLNSSTDGQLDIVADTEVQIAATTIDINGNADISGNLGIGGNLTVTGTTTFNGGTLTLGDANTDNIVFGGEVDSDIVPDDDDTHDLGSSSKQWKDIYIDGVAYVDAIDFNGTAISATAAELNIIDGDTTATSTTLADADRVVVNDAGTMKQVALTDFETYFESALDTLSNGTTVGALDSGSITSGFGTIDTGSSTITTTGAITGGSLVVDNFTLNGTELDLSSGDFTLDVAGDIILNTDDGIVSLQDASATFGSLENSSGNLVIKSGTTTALTFSGADATIAGDLTISGDDLTMGTNTSGHIMVADGTNFNPVAVSGDVTIASDGAVTIANGAVETAMVNANVITGQTAETSLDTSNDTILIHDADAGSLKKTTLASISSALGGITDVVADTSPQLGGNLDTNSHNILIDDAHFIADESGNEQIIFNTTSSAVNQFEITNSASSTAFTQGPHLSVSGSDSEIDLNLAAKGAGHIVIKGNDNPGAIRFNCESNSHGQTLIGAAHAAGATNTLVLPTDAGTLVGTGDTGTVTNAMLAGSIAASKLAGSIGDSKLSTITTAGKVALSALEIDGASDIGADLADADLIIVDDGAGGTEVKSELTRVKKYIYSAMSGDATASDAGALTIANDAVESGMLNDNIISGQTELASGLATTDELLVSDAGTIKRMDMSVVSTFMTSEGFSKEDPTALAIALG